MEPLGEERAAALSGPFFEAGMQGPSRAPPPLRFAPGGTRAVVADATLRYARTHRPRALAVLSRGAAAPASGGLSRAAVAAPAHYAPGLAPLGCRRLCSPAPPAAAAPPGVALRRARTQPPIRAYAPGGFVPRRRPRPCPALCSGSRLVALAPLRARPCPLGGFPGAPPALRRQSRRPRPFGPGPGCAPPRALCGPYGPLSRAAPGAKRKEVISWLPTMGRARTMRPF